MKHRNAVFPKRIPAEENGIPDTECEINENLVGENIRRLRRQKNMNQDMLAAELNLLRQTISAYERGVTLPDLYVLIAMADLFGVTVDELIGRTGYVPPDDQIG